MTDMPEVQGDCVMCHDSSRGKWVCSECSESFCAGIIKCGGKFVLASLGETNKRYICSGCLEGIRKKIAEKKEEAPQDKQEDRKQEEKKKEEEESSKKEEDSTKKEEDKKKKETRKERTSRKGSSIRPSRVSQHKKELALSASALAAADEVDSPFSHSARTHSRSDLLPALSRQGRRPSTSSISSSPHLNRSNSSDSLLSVDSPPILRRASPKRRHQRTVSELKFSRKSSPQVSEPKLPLRKSNVSRSRRSRKKNSIGFPARRSKASPSFDMLTATLDEIMEWQAHKPRFENCKVPYVIQWLLENILKHGGARAEGIFRLSIASSRIDEFCSRLSEARFDFETNDPHSYAVMLKHFLRNLPQPLIPDYEVCMRARDVDLATNAGLATYWKLWDEVIPAVSKEVILTLVEFLVVMSLPSHVAATKMSMENYVIVFAPAFLRNPKSDVESMLMGQAREQNFVEQLLLFCKEHVRHKLENNKDTVLKTIVEYVDADGKPCAPPDEGEDVDIEEVILYVDGSEESVEYSDENEALDVLM